MVLQKAYIELSRAGDGFTATIVSEKSDCACFIIDGSYTELDGLSCSGDEYASMVDLSTRYELSDLTKQPILLFYFTVSKSFCVNFAPIYFRVNSSTPFAAAGVFSPAIVELKNSKSGSSIGEFQYKGATIYPTIGGFIRSVETVPTYMNKAPSSVVDPSKYSRSIDTKQPTKKVSYTGWTFGYRAKYPRVEVWSTADNLYKLGSYFLYNTNQTITNISTSTGQMQHNNTFARTSSKRSYRSYGYNCDWKYNASHISKFVTETNFPSTLFNSDPSHIASTELTTGNIAGNNYIFHGDIVAGVGDILEIDSSNSSVSVTGKSYTCNSATTTTLARPRIVITVPGYNPPVKDVNNSMYRGKYIVAKDELLSGKMTIIRTPTEHLLAASGSVTGCRKLKLDAGYIITLSKAGTKTQTGQGHLFSNIVVGYRSKNIVISGFLMSVIDSNNNKLVDSYNVGYVYNSDLAELRTRPVKAIALYDDDSIATSTVLNGHGLMPIRVSPDCKNIRFDLSILTDTYLNDKVDTYADYEDPSPTMKPIVDNAFVVPENTGSKTIKAVGFMIEGSSLDSGNAIYTIDWYYSDVSKLIISPKT